MVTQRLTIIIPAMGSRVKTKEGSNTMANENETTSQFNENAVNAAQDVLADLKDKAKQAIEANDVFMSALMTDLIKTVSPLVTKSIARLHREERAQINAQHKKLCEKVREMPRPNLTRE
jgi:hypothetical protein